MKRMLALLASLCLVLAVQACTGEAEAEEKTTTHRLKVETEYYLSGPAQAAPPDGNLAVDTEVELLEEAGSYARVRTPDGVEAFVSADALEPLD